MHLPSGERRCPLEMCGSVKRDKTLSLRKGATLAWNLGSALEIWTLGAEVASASQVIT